MLSNLSSTAIVIGALRVKFIAELLILDLTTLMIIVLILVLPILNFGLNFCTVKPE